MRALLRFSLAVMALAALAPAAVSQQAFPTHPIRLIVPYPAGGATDVVARIVAEKMSEELGQQIYVDNRPGAGTMIGASAVARSDAGRLHDADRRYRNLCAQPDSLRQATHLRSDQGLCAGEPHRAYAVDPRRQSQHHQGQFCEGTDRGRKEGAG